MIAQRWRVECQTMRAVIKFMRYVANTRKHMKNVVENQERSAGSLVCCKVIVCCIVITVDFIFGCRKNVQLLCWSIKERADVALLLALFVLLLSFNRWWRWWCWCYRLCFHAVIKPVMPTLRGFRSPCVWTPIKAITRLVERLRNNHNVQFNVIYCFNCFEVQIQTLLSLLVTRQSDITHKCNEVEH